MMKMCWPLVLLVGCYSSTAAPTSREAEVLEATEMAWAELVGPVSAECRLDSMSWEYAPDGPFQQACGCGPYDFWVDAECPEPADDSVFGVCRVGSSWMIYAELSVDQQMQRLIVAAMRELAICEGVALDDVRLDPVGLAGWDTVWARAWVLFQAL